MSTHTAPTTATGLAAANEIFSRDDWDAGYVVSTHLPAKIAEDLLLARGWTVEVSPRGAERWTSPTGLKCWGPTEALTLALTAEVAS